MAMKKNILRFASVCSLITTVINFASHAHAATAEYVAPDSLTSMDLAALSSDGDGAGYLVGLNQTLAIQLDTPVGVTNGGSVTVFSLPPDTGVARGVLRVGRYNGGAPDIVASRNCRAGNDRSINNLFNRGCGILGGCDYIEIFTRRTRRGAGGVEVDYIVVDGEVIEVTSPSPEPSTWALMILAFAGIAIRLKTVRRSARQTQQPVSPAGLHTPPSPDQAVLQTGHP